MKKILCFVIIFILAFSPMTVLAAPYLSFTYNFWGQYVPAPAAYVPVMTIGAHDICETLGDFVNPSDMSSDRYGNIFVMDTGNNRVVIFDRGLNLINVINNFERDGQPDRFNNAQGIFVCADQLIHVADTDNRRIVTLDMEANFIRQLYNPEIPDIEDDIDFRPLRVLIGQGGRIFVIVMHVFEGIMSFNRYGEFMGYFGTIAVRFNPVDMFWRSIATQAQRERLRLFIPTEFLAMDLDEYGFVFATNRDRWGGDVIQRLNPRGNNVIVNFNSNVGISGTQNFPWFGTLGGPSVLVDVSARPYGKFSLLDSNRGRVYTYDSEGNLLYAFAGTGNIVGMGRRPVALETIGDSILVLDGLRGQIVYFEPTEYGRLINEAVSYRYRGNEPEAYLRWRRLLEIDEHFTLAHAGVGLSLLAQGENALAREYLRRGMNLRYYSVALRRHRNDMLAENLGSIFTGGLVAVLSLVGFRIYRRIKKKKDGAEGGAEE